MSFVDVIASPSFDAAIASDGAAVSGPLFAAMASDGADVSALLVSALVVFGRRQRVDLALIVVSRTLELFAIANVG